MNRHHRPPQRAQIAAFLALTVVMVWSPAVNAATVVLDHDTTIDAGSSFAGAHIQVIDGIGGPTHVHITNGGAVAGFDGHGNSEINLNGGSITFLSSLQDNAKFTMYSGQVGCTEAVCLVSDYDALFVAGDSSQLYLYGGSIGGIRLDDSAVAHFFGEDLKLNVFDQQFAFVEGTYLNGDPVSVGFHFRPDIAEHIILNNVPEPSLATGLVALASLFLYRFRVTGDRNCAIIACRAEKVAAESDIDG
jgi:hypothetical protein